jgi:hypothetical protein
MLAAVMLHRASLMPACTACLPLASPPSFRESENGERIKDLELIMAKVAEVRGDGAAYLWLGGYVC